MCTRFATEVILRPAPTAEVSVAIVPSESRIGSERQSLENFQEPLTALKELPALIESAKLAMGITGHGKAFAKDILRIEITGPDRPHLTIVDLHGHIDSATGISLARRGKAVKEPDSPLPEASSPC